MLEGNRGKKSKINSKSKSSKWEEKRKKFLRDREIENVTQMKYEEIEKRGTEEVIEKWGKIEE